MKKGVMVLVVAALFASCSKGIPVEKYIEVMTALGCQTTLETMPQAEVIFKEKGVTLQEIQDFRKKVDPKKAMELAMKISRQVAACHGVTVPTDEGQ